MPARLRAHARAARQPEPSSPAELARCIIDSLALAYRRAIDDAARLSGRQVRVVHVVGGGSQDELLCQATADATGFRSEERRVGKDVSTLAEPLAGNRP